MDLSNLARMASNIRLLLLFDSSIRGYFAGEMTKIYDRPVSQHFTQALNTRGSKIRKDIELILWSVKLPNLVNL